MGKVGCAHATSLLSSLRPQASTSSPGHSRGRFVQARPAMRPATSRCQAQAQPAINRTAGNPLATKLLTAAAYHILRGAMLASKDPNQTPAGLNLRAGAASCATPRCPPPRGLARPLCYAHARRNCWAQGRRRQAVCRCCCWWGQALRHHHRRRHRGAGPQAALYQAASPPARAACSSQSWRRSPVVQRSTGRHLPPIFLQ